MRIVEAVARVAEDRAEHYAQWAVRETGFGVVADKVVKNRLCSRGILDAYRDHDYVDPAHRQLPARSSSCRGPPAWCWR